ncbi:MAG: YiiX/YebB-like N1pC/P60 family cysteine hydrolase [Pseudomonadota bacterium]
MKWNISKIFMFKVNIRVKLWQKIVQWLNKEEENSDLPLVDFKQMCDEIRPGDVLLFEGRSRVSQIIKLLTQSSWTHAAIYIGRMHEVTNPISQFTLKRYYNDAPDSGLIIESMLGYGTTVSALNKYQKDHIRVCRPIGITLNDCTRIVDFVVGKLGTEYNFRQLLDLARFFFPYSILPPRWRSSLFMHNSNTATKMVCSTMISKAFQSVKFPVLPVRNIRADGKLDLSMRNPRLITPKDFDFSPYFNIIKYPLYGLKQRALYRQIPWNENGLVCHGPDDCYLPEKEIQAVMLKKKVEKINKQKKK